MVGSTSATLAERFGTPLYVYDGDAILRCADAIDRAIGHRPLRILYSTKANSALALAALLRGAGLGLDACSPGDLELAVRAGFSPHEISYTGFGASVEELREASRRCATVVVDGLAELERAAEAGLARVGLRINPGITAGFHEHVMAGTSSAKFGLPVELLPQAAALAAQLGVTVEGLHAHLGSDLLDAGPHIELLGLLAELAGCAPSIRWLNVGGGFGTPRRDGDRAYDWAAFGAAAETLLGSRAQPLELRIEPGGHLLMDAGVLLARVTEVRPAAGGEPATAVVDASTNLLVSVLLYDAHHPVSLVSRESADPAVPQRIAGPLMQAGDVLATRAELPPLRPGDLVAFGHAGAYASSRATTFNERPRPAEVLVRAGEGCLIRRAESSGDLYARDLLA